MITLEFWAVVESNASGLYLCLFLPVEIYHRYTNAIPRSKGTRFYDTAKLPFQKIVLRYVHTRNHFQSHLIDATSGRAG